MSMKAALHDHIEKLSDEDAEQLLASLRGYQGNVESLELLRRFERAREGFWRDEYASDADFEEALRQGARDLVVLLQPAELELAVHVWEAPEVGGSSDRERLMRFVEAAHAETLAQFVDYLNNRLDPEELLPAEESRMSPTA